MNNCPLCGRYLEPGTTNIHHLVPKHKGGVNGEVVELHKFCHSKIHSTFTNAELAKHFNTVEMLKSHPDIEKFIKWVRKKPPAYYVKNAQHSGKRQ